MQLGLGPVVGHPGPCGVVAEDQPDALKGQLAEYPEAEHLLENWGASLAGLRPARDA